MRFYQWQHSSRELEIKARFNECQALLTPKNIFKFQGLHITWINCGIGRLAFCQAWQFLISSHYLTPTRLTKSRLLICCRRLPSKVTQHYRSNYRQRDNFGRDHKRYWIQNIHKKYLWFQWRSEVLDVMARANHWRCKWQHPIQHWLFS